MLTVSLLLDLAAFVTVLAAVYGKAPLWLAVLLVILERLLNLLPLR